MGSHGFPLAALVSGALLMTLHPHIDKSPLRHGVVGSPYADTVRLRDGEDAWWEIKGGRLPPGIHLNGYTGELAGVPTESGKFEFDVRATWRGRRDTEKFKIEIEERPVVDNVDADDFVETLLGATGGMGEDLAESLDRQGNDNGRLDIGDLRAYLRLTGDLPAAP
jgi:hypothetical protein